MVGVHGDACIRPYFLCSIGVDLNCLIDWVELIVLSARYRHSCSIFTLICLRLTMNLFEGGLECDLSLVCLHGYMSMG